MSVSSLPMHIGFILDGNRRWAVSQGLPTLEGHQRGYENLKTIAQASFERGIQYVSAYVFSTENWNRSHEEVKYLMNLLIWIAKNEVVELDKENIRVRFMGSRDRLSKRMTDAMGDAEARTLRNTGGQLLICLNYGGHQEIVDAVNTIIIQNNSKPITLEQFARYLYAPDVPAVDLVVRTSGEQRLSNFMLWRSAYSELLFVDKHWPAFTATDLDAALENYKVRQRRFGK